MEVNLYTVSPHKASRAASNFPLTGTPLDLFRAVQLNWLKPWAGVHSLWSAPSPQTPSPVDLAACLWSHSALGAGGRCAASPQWIPDRSNPRGSFSVGPRRGLPHLKNGLRFLHTQNLSAFDTSENDSGFLIPWKPPFCAKKTPMLTVKQRREEGGHLRSSC